MFCKTRFLLARTFKAPPLENRAAEVIVEITDINGRLVFTQRFENSQLQQIG
jgi:hypothetical protein